MNIIDLHCDTIYLLLKTNEGLWENTCHFDLKRALNAGIFLQFFSLFSMPSDSNIVLRDILKQIEKFYYEFDKNQNYLYLVKSYKDIQDNMDNINKIGCVLHLEGAEAIGPDVDILYLLYRLGLRSLGLTWNRRNLLADGVEEGEGAGGLSKLGRDIVNKAEKLGIIIDLSHISQKSFFDVLENYNKPIMVTHANAYKLCPHPRNLNDDQLKALAQNKGIIGITQVCSFVAQGSAALEDLLNHIVYISELIGTEYIGLGSDFDGADNIVMSGIEEYSIWTELLKGKGFTKKEIKGILKDNALRVISSVL
ncbi:membrane dipeptidase [Thermosyntropha sp.]|uniref:dipeptidase n=1 Tax=Thermosyntropha sp. TaxID=2740820 RepID=UPI0025EEC8AA|nr:membrane dipeptidase [Thermosyntropha sp.]MBO8158534.1 membrane dipeptidase [Thermosyntropha sp.]